MLILHESGEGKVQKLREGCLKRGRRTRGMSPRTSPFSFHIDVRTPNAVAYLGNNKKGTGF